MIIIGMLVGAFLNIFTGITPSLTFLTGLWIWHAILYILVAMFGLFTYAMMALFLATLGRASVAGVAGALVWSLLEPVIGGALFLIGSFNKSPVGDFLKAIPDYFIGNNIGTLLQNQSHFILNDQPAAQSDLHAILVLATYLVLFIGLSLWINTRRDVTN
jgi:hypothetical protein